MFRIIGYNLFRFEAGARPKHPEYATRELARRGDDGSFVTEGAVSFRFVERGDLVLVTEAKHDRHGDKGNSFFTILGNLISTSFGYPSLNRSSFPFILYDGPTIWNTLQ